MSVLARGSVAARALTAEVGAEAGLEPRRRSGGFEIGGLLVVVALTFLPHGFDVIIGRWDWETIDNGCARELISCVDFIFAT